MFKVEYDETVIISINNFVNWYLNTFLERFNDSWIFNENIIVNNYKNKSIELKKSIFSEVENNFWNLEILGYKPLKNNIRKTWILVWNYRLFIEYSEDLENKIRFIEKVEFHKK